MSNQFVPTPTHSPLEISGHLLKSVELLHWSWSYIVTQALMTQYSNEFESDDQKYILMEFTRYMEDDKKSFQTFDSMHPNWKDFVTNVRSGAKPKKSDPDLVSTISDWQEEIRDLSLKFSQWTRTPVSIKLSPKQRNDPSVLYNDNLGALINDGKLQASLVVPNAASPIELIADIRNSTVSCSITTNAPDNPRAKSRINWLVRQIPEGGHDENVFIELIGGRGSNLTQEFLVNLRKDPDCVLKDNPNLLPTGFRIKKVSDLKGNFASRRKFIESFEKLAREFYEEVGEHIKNWVPKPAKIIEASPEDPPQSPNSIESTGQQQTQGNISRDDSKPPDIGPSYPIGSTEE